MKRSSHHQSALPSVGEVFAYAKADHNIRRFRMVKVTVPTWIAKSNGLPCFRAEVADLDDPTEPVMERTLHVEGIIL